MRPLFGFVLLLVLLGCPGCGDRRERGGSVSGKVTINGAPVTAGNVLIVSENGKLTAIGPIRGDGTFTVKEPPLGKVALAVQTEQFRRPPPPPPKGGASGPPAKDAGSPGMVLPQSSERGLVYKEIPKRYEQPATANLTHVVERGETVCDLVLTDK